MLPKINQINIRNFRGIREISIPFTDKNNLLIIGDNGTGKSSIVDSIEFFFKLEVSKLSGRQDISVCDCIPFANSDPFDCKVECKFDLIQDPIPAVFIPTTLGKKGIANRADVPELKDVFDFARTHNFVLHRAQLTHFIESKPADRYDSISELIGLEILDKAINVWRKEKSEREHQKNETNTKYSDLTLELSRFLLQKVDCEKDIVNSINSRLILSFLNPINSTIEIENVISDLAKTSGNPQDQTLSNQYRNFISQIQQFIDGWQGFNILYNTLCESWQNYLEKAEGLSDSDSLEIIKEGHKLIIKNQLDSCPVCEQPINRDDLIARLEFRAKELSELSEARSVLETNKKEANISLLRCRTIWDSIERSIISFKWEFPEEIIQSKQLLEILEQKIEARPLTLASDNLGPGNSIFENAFKVFSDLTISANEQIRSLTPNEEERKKAELAYFLGQANEKVTEWKKARKISEQAVKEFVFIDQLFTSLVEARKQGVSQIIESLEIDFIQLYEKLHPGEGHKAIKIILIPERTASADILTETEGLVSMHPLGNYSEGHLDSLGLCIFLAFIKRFNKSFPLIVLDDVLTSIDAGHRMKVAQLLAKEFKDHQIIITTHDELWGNELAAVMRKEQSSLKIVRMNPWTKENGATFDEYVSTNWEYYRQQIASGKSQDAIGSAGRNLEKFLVTMRRNLHLSIPATIDDHYMLGSLSPAFWKWVRENHIQRPDFLDFTKQLEMLNDEYDAYWYFRNWSGAHYNEWGSTVSAIEAQNFISILEELVSYFECPVCKSLVVYDSSRKLVHCPVCAPTSSPKILWEYKPHWIDQANKLISNKDSIKNFENHLLTLSKSAFEKLLRDSRKRMQLLVKSKMDDSYDMADLYPPLIQQLLMHPNKMSSKWNFELETFDREFRHFMTKDFIWLDDINLLPQVNLFYEIISSFAKMVSCPDCHELLNFDSAVGDYICSKCTSQTEEPNIAPAAWFVIK